MVPCGSRLAITIPAKAGMMIAFDWHRTTPDIRSSERLGQSKDGDGAKPRRMEFEPCREFSIQNVRCQVKVDVLFSEQRASSIDTVWREE